MLVLCCKAPLILQPTPCPCPYSFFMIYQFDITVLSRAFKNISLAEKKTASPISLNYRYGWMLKAV